MGKTLVGQENIIFDYIIEVEGYQRPILLLQFSLNASMTMRYKTSGKSSRWDHVTDTRRCTIKYDKEFNREVKITTLFGGNKPQIRYRGGQTFPIDNAGLEIGFENMLEKEFAAITNIFEKGHCGSKKGRRRRRRALKIYRKGFHKAVKESVNQIINLLGNEAASIIRDRLKDPSTGEKLTIRRVIPRAIPENNTVSKEFLAKQVHKSITGSDPTKKELAELLAQGNINSMTKLSSDIHVTLFLEKKSQIEESIEPLNTLANKIAELIEQGGGRRGPEVETIPGESSDQRENRQKAADLFNGITCLVSWEGGHMSPDYFPDNIDLSKQIDDAFNAFDEIRIPIDKWLEEGRNITRLLNVLQQDQDELEELLDDIEDKLENAREKVSRYVYFKKQLYKCLNTEKRAVPQLRRSEILEIINNSRELTLPIKLDNININDPRIFDDFDDYLPDEIDPEDFGDITIAEFLASMPSLTQLDSNKIDLIKSQLELIKTNEVFDTDIRNHALQIEGKISHVLDAENLEKLDTEIQNLGNRISETF